MFEIENQNSLLLVLLLFGGLNTMAQSDGTHMLTLKSGATLPVIIKECTDSVLTYISNKHEGSVTVNNIKDLSIKESGYKDRPYQKSNARGSHLMKLKSGASLYVFILSLNDTLVTYSLDGHTGTVSIESIQLITSIKNIPSLDFGEESSEEGLISRHGAFAIYKSGSKGAQKNKDTTAVFKSKGIIGFVDFGAKFGLVEEESWTYASMSFFLDGGAYIPFKNNFYYGGSAGIHSYILYSAAFLPIKAQFKYILKPDKRKSFALNGGIGYGLQIAHEAPIKYGGFTYNYGFSIAKSKTSKRVTEWNFGFLADNFESDKRLWLRNIGSTTLKQYVSANRFYISKRWWFK